MHDMTAWQLDFTISSIFCDRSCSCLIFCTVAYSWLVHWVIMLCMYNLIIHWNSGGTKCCFFKKYFLWLSFIFIICIFLDIFLVLNSYISYPSFFSLFSNNLNSLNKCITRKNETDFSRVPWTKKNNNRKLHYWEFQPKYTELKKNFQFFSERVTCIYAVGKIAKKNNLKVFC